MARTRLIRSMLLTLTVTLMSGCKSGDERLAEYADKASERQARQNEEIARQSQQGARQSGELAQAAHELVEQDAASRRELIQAQAELQDHVHEERRRLDEQRQSLQSEQKALASARQRDSLVGQAMLMGGIALAALLPLLVTAYALSRLPGSAASESELLTDLLVDELARQPSMNGNSAGDSPMLPLADHSRLAGPGQAPAPPHEPPA